MLSLLSDMCVKNKALELKTAEMCIISPKFPHFRNEFSNDRRVSHLHQTRDRIMVYRYEFSVCSDMQKNVRFRS